MCIVLECMLSVRPLNTFVSCPGDSKLNKACELVKYMKIYLPYRTPPYVFVVHLYKCVVLMMIELNSCYI